MSVYESGNARARPRWGDIRFVLGVVLIAASVAGVWLVVSAARQTAAVFATTRTIVPGEVVSSDDLRIVEVTLGTLGETYATPETSVTGMVATRTIAAGELVPLGAVGDAADARVTTVVLQSAVDVPAAVDTGAVVDVWVAPLVERGRYDVPRILVADATVLSVARDRPMIGGGTATLELVIPRSEVAAALAAMADDSALSVVPTGAQR